MNEIDLIKIKGEQPAAEISNNELEYLIERDYLDKSNLVKEKLNKIISNSHQRKNRISAAVLKIANTDLTKINNLIKMANQDYRDVISAAEYPRAIKTGLTYQNEDEMKSDFLKDWNEYIEWKEK